jgi:hypothetical protein
VVEKFENNERKPTVQPSMWKTFAFYSGATLQLVVSMLVFGFFGRQLSKMWHSIWPTVIGVAVGVVVGTSGLVLLAKRILGGKR